MLKKLSTWKRIVFKSSVIAKIVDGVFGVLVGGLFYIIPKNNVLNLVQDIFSNELIEDPTDLSARLFINFFNNLSISTQHFIGFYLFFNGFVKIFLMSFVLKKKLWVYPFTIVYLGVWSIYEIYRLSYTYSLFLIFVIVWDLVIMYFTYIEYQRLVLQHKQEFNPDVPKD